MTSATSPFLLLLLLAVTAAGAPIPLLALLSLKFSLVDPLSSLQDWSYLSATAAGLPPWCSWSGVTCSAAGEVTALDLSRRNLSGTISSEVRLLYPSLAHLNLSGNAFRGPLPTAIFDLCRLQTLDLSHNDFNSSFSAATRAARPHALLLYAEITFLVGVWASLQFRWIQIENPFVILALERLLISACIPVAVPALFT